MDWLGFLHGHVGVDFARGFLVRIFGCGFWGADFSRILGADFFADFVMACADFGCGFFLQIFLAVFPQKKYPEKIPSKNPTEKSSPKI